MNERLSDVAGAYGTFSNLSYSFGGNGDPESIKGAFVGMRALVESVDRENDAVAEVTIGISSTPSAGL